MMRDRLYQRILDGLAKPRFSGSQFEECACDLLRAVFPGLAPVGGSGDFGMDGAIPNGREEPYPLVCTMEENVLRNLTHSLDRRQQTGSPSRLVVVATSQALTPRRQENLKARARAKGFVLTQIFDRRAIANLLYRDSRWRLELLGVGGEPLALTAIPRTRRPLVEMEPLGRDADIDWLTDTKGDRVLAGQPGSGKTCLLHHLINSRSWNALFLDAERSAPDIADALLDLEPDVVIVDDAHLHHQTLERLIHVRREGDFQFSIVATTWPSGVERVVEALGGSVAKRKLELLSRHEIKSILEQMGVSTDGAGNGIWVSHDMMRYLIDQAAHRPGWAVTLARLMLQGSSQEVLDGSALSRTLLYDLTSERQARDLLAALALGGDHGMGLMQAAEFLQIGLADALASAGLLVDLGVVQDREALLPPMMRGPEGTTLSVWPRPLRWRLVKSRFFESPRPDIRPLLERASSRHDCIETLLGARAIGAAVDVNQLGELVRGEQSTGLWNEFARLGQSESRWALRHYPGNILDIAAAALRGAPEVALERILEKAAATPGEGQPGANPWAVLRDWIAEGSLDSRQLLARAALAFRPRHLSVATAALFVALDPTWQRLDPDPAVADLAQPVIGRRDPTTVKLCWGRLSLPALASLREMWRGAQPTLGAIDGAAWPHVERAVWLWIRPDPAKRHDPSDEALTAMRQVGIEIVRGLVPLVAGSPGLTLRLAQLARNNNLGIEIEVDPTFALLYSALSGLGPSREAALAARLEEIHRIASQWLERPMAEVVELLVRYEEEAKTFRLGSGERLVERLAEALAQRVTDPATWLEAFLQHNLPPLGAPFLAEVDARRGHGWEDYLGRCFALSLPWRWVASQQILEMPEAPAHLMESALLAAEELTWMVETLTLRRQLPLANLRQLLGHPVWQVAAAAAAGEYYAAGSGTWIERVRIEVRAEWRQAVLRARGADREEEELTVVESRLAAIVGGDPQLAFDWLMRRLADPNLAVSFSEEGIWSRAIAALDPQQKARVLEQLPDCAIAGPLVERMVDGDPQRFRVLLARRELEKYHLLPLGIAQDGMAQKERREALAAMALDAGYTTEEISRMDRSAGPIRAGRVSAIDPDAQ